MISVVSHIVKYSCGKTNNTKRWKSRRLVVIKLLIESYFKICHFFYKILYSWGKPKCFSFKIWIFNYILIQSFFLWRRLNLCKNGHSKQAILFDNSPEKPRASSADSDNASVGQIRLWRQKELHLNPGKTP